MTDTVQALAYYYTRILIYRPAVTSSLGPKAAPATITVGESSKHIIQIIELLEERNMSFSFCLNKADTLVLCGMALLFQSMDLKQDSKMLRDNEKLVNSAIKAVDKAKAPGCFDFKRVAGMLITVDEPAPQSLPTPPGQSPDTSLAAPPAHRTSPATAHKAHPTLGRHLAASMSETDLLLQQEKLRRMTMTQHHHQQQTRADQLSPRSRGSFDSPRPTTLPLSQRDHRLSLSQAQAAQAAMLARLSTSPNANTKQTLDYLHLDSPQPPSPAQARHQQHHMHAHAHHHQQQHHHSASIAHNQQAHLYAQLQKGSSSTSTAEWEALLGSLDSGQLNVYDAIYGGPGLALAEQQQSAAQHQQQQQATANSVSAAAAAAATWSPDSWDLTGFNLGDFGSGTGSEHSVVSLSEDGLSSGDELVGSVGSGLEYAGGMHLSVGAGGEGYVLDGFGL